MIRSIVLGLGLSAVISLPAMAEIYKRVDDYGNVTYTNIPPPGAVVQQQPASAAAARGRAQQQSARVSVGEQQTRDTESRRILEAELEKANVAAAEALKRKDLDAVARSNADVEAIKHELARLK